MLKDYYAILGVAEDASVAEIRQHYQRLLLIHHPDKQQQNQSLRISSRSLPSSSSSPPLIPLQDIKEAWECLRLPAQRAFYDSSLKAMRLHAIGQVNDDVDLDEMEFDEGKCLTQFVIVHSLQAKTADLNTFIHSFTMSQILASSSHAADAAAIISSR
ncbi:hypothetical protein BGZ65_006138 [Modicella reniformis]|uniref:J domain-containing protein n=1 Tax=Modicella reniformis TaxID=1440133 RepID=A0A9P6J599_9FUNG|nr:hypothetical protein BGZ65_006138 [Modicella reniformis]